MEGLDDPAQRLRLAFELYEYAEAIMRENLRHRYPHASDAEIEVRLEDWVAKRSPSGQVAADPSFG